MKTEYVLLSKHVYPEACKYDEQLKLRNISYATPSKCRGLCSLVEAIDQSIIRHWLTVFIIRNEVVAKVDGTIVVVPVLDQHDLLLVVKLSSVSLFRGMNNEWSKNPVEILCPVMRMIPVCPELAFDGKAIHKRPARGNAALSNSWNTVITQLCMLGKENSPTVPSYQFVPFCSRPCQWMLVEFLLSLLVTLTTKRSPLLISMSGPGNFPLMKSISRTTPKPTL